MGLGGAADGQVLAQVVAKLAQVFDAGYDAGLLGQRWEGDQRIQQYALI